MAGTLAGLTYGILNHRAQERDAAPVPTEPRRTWFDVVDTWFWKQELASREAFLAKSADIVELEQRMRWLEQGR